ncbi:chromosome partitioning protein ParB [Salmonella enterica]|nr:chromosome partitioning protein ParB [Salmonella enterica]EBR1292738.1 chromosome partitioning protein ParB [Salmonella enterica]
MLSAAKIKHDRQPAFSAAAIEEGMKRVNFQLPADKHRKLKIYAAKMDKTITELLTEYVDQLPVSKEEIGR